MPDEPSAEIGRFHAFRYRNYRFLWAGNAFTGAAQWIQGATLGWVVYDLTGSASILGMINGIRTIPTVLVTPVAGMTADRFSRNRIIALSQFALALNAMLLAAALATDYIAVWYLFAFTLIAATANTFNMPARQTLIFDLVPRNVIPNAVALNNLASSMTRSLGPMIGGALIVAFGPANNFFIQACAYVCVMLSVLMIRLPEKPTQAARKQPLLSEMLEGYAFVLRTPQMRLLILMMIINPLFLIPLHNTLLPIFTKESFASNAGTLGILLSSIGMGGIIGGLITASLNNVDRRGLLQIAALCIYTLAQATFSLVAYFTHEVWLAVGFLVIAGAAESVSATTNQTVLQLTAPDHLRGRISSALQFNPIVMSVGALFAGSMASIFGAPAVGFGMGMTGFGVVLLIFIFSPRIRNLRISQLNRDATRIGAEG